MQHIYAFAKLEISDAAYREIAGLLLEAGYDHVFVLGSESNVIDMHGIGLIPKSRSAFRQDADAQHMNELALAHRRPIREPLPQADGDPGRIPIVPVPQNE